MVSWYWMSGTSRWELLNFYLALWYITPQELATRKVVQKSWKKDVQKSCSPSIYKLDHNLGLIKKIRAVRFLSQLSLNHNFIGYGFSNPWAVNNSSFSRISFVRPSATILPSPITMVRGKSSFTKAMLCVETNIGVTSHSHQFYTCVCERRCAARFCARLTVSAEKNIVAWTSTMVAPEATSI